MRVIGLGRRGTEKNTLRADQPFVMILEKLGWSRKVECMLPNVAYFSGLAREGQYSLKMPTTEVPTSDKACHNMVSLKQFN